MEKLEWSAFEYEEKERNKDWFWALGIIVVTGTIASFIYGNYFFAVLIILGGILLGVFATKKPEEVFYELNDKGLRIRNRLYLYRDINSFWVRNEGSAEENLPAMLFIKSERVFMPIVGVHLVNEIVNEVREIMLSKNIPEEEMQEHVSEKIMDYLGF